MTRPDQELISAFRSVLPNGPNRDMWVNETYLELRRMRQLRAQGFECRPDGRSLLGTLLSLESPAVPSDDGSPSLQGYETVFGHAPTYCWTKDVSELRHVSAPGGSQPAIAWMNLDDQ